MSNIAMHMRMTGLQVQNEDVDARKKSIGELAAKWSKVRNIDPILRKAAEVVQSLHGDGQADQALRDEVQAVVQTHASAFLASESPLEIGICAGCAVLEIVEPAGGGDAWTPADVYAAAVWAGLSFQPPLENEKREALRVEVLEACRKRCLTSAEAARERTAVNDFGEFVPTAGDEGKTQAAFKKATASTILALRRNAALDREELDFLWWAQTTRSRLLGKQYDQISEPVRLVVCGLEAASKLRRLPSDVHRDVAMRTLKENPACTLAELLAAAGDDLTKIGDQFKSGSAAKFPVLFPLLWSLSSNDANVVGGEIKRTSEDWGARALLEAGLSQMSANGVGTL